MRIIAISLAFLACTQLHGQERFYNFIDGWVSNYSIELDDKYMTIGLSAEGGSSEHRHIYYELELDGEPIDSTYFGIDSLYTTTHYAYSSSVAIELENELLIAGYGGNLGDFNTSTGFLFSYDYSSPPTTLQTFSEGTFTALDYLEQMNETALLVGGRHSEPGGIRESFVSKLDLLGNVVWSSTTSCGIWCVSRVVDIIPLTDGGIGVLISEYDNSFPNQEETLRTVLLKLDAQGEEEWRRYPGDWEDFHINPGGIVEVGNEILVAYTDPYLYNEDDEWSYNDSNTVHLVRYELDGDVNTDISLLFDIPNSLDLYGRYRYDVSQLQVLGDGNILCSGSTNGGLLLLKLNPLGEIIWFREHLYFPPNLDDWGQFARLNHVLPTNDGGFLGTGEFEHSPTIDNPLNIQTAIALKVDEYGCLEPGCQLVDGIEEYPSGASGASSLKVWPNPTTGELGVEIPYGINPSDIEFVEVRDELGRKIHVRFQTRDLENGVLNVEPLLAGVYLIQLITSEHLYSAKFIKE